MDIRSVQKTGDMKYLYLPTKWCKEQKITANSKVMVEQKSDGSLLIVPELRDRKVANLNLTLDDDDFDIIQKLIVACYINPADSFRISLKKTIDPVKLMENEGLVSLEMVEIDENQVICESEVAVSDPESLLRTSIRKIKNVLIIMMKNNHEKLIARYENEIDRNKLLISKAVIGALTYRAPSRLKSIELHYTGLISTHLEGMADHLIVVEQDNEFLEQVMDAVDCLQKIFERLDELTHNEAIVFLKKVGEITTPIVKDLDTYRKRRVKKYLVNTGEVLLDWSVTKEVEK
jgi:phosphate uptake regulator